MFAFAAVVAFVSFGAEAQTTTSSASLPAFTFNLVSEPIADRENLCSQNMGYCINNCGGTSKAPKNFCNATTMGWGCGCVDKVPDYQAYQWPINYANCVGCGQACQSACQGNNSCIASCSSAYNAVCGTPNQPPAYYEVSDPSITPSYGPPNNSTATTGSATVSSTSSPDNSTTTTKSNDANVLSYSMLYLLVIVAGGMMML